MTRGELWCIYCRRPMYFITYIDSEPDAWLCICRNLVQRTRRKQTIDTTPLAGVPLTRLMKDQPV